MSWGFWVQPFKEKAPFILGGYGSEILTTVTVGSTSTSAAQWVLQQKRERNTRRKNKRLSLINKRLSQTKKKEKEKAKPNEHREAQPKLGNPSTILFLSLSINLKKKKSLLIYTRENVMLCVKLVENYAFKWSILYMCCNISKYFFYTIS